MITSRHPLTSLRALLGRLALLTLLGLSLAGCVIPLVKELPTSKGINPKEFEREPYGRMVISLPEAFTIEKATFSYQSSSGALPIVYPTGLPKITTPIPFLFGWDFARPGPSGRFGPLPVTTTANGNFALTLPKIKGQNLSAISFSIARKDGEYIEAPQLFLSFSKGGSDTCRAAEYRHAARCEPFNLHGHDANGRFEHTAFLLLDTPSLCFQLLPATGQRSPFQASSSRPAAHQADGPCAQEETKP